MDRVRRALGRSAPLDQPPVPPPIEEPIARLVYSDIGLPELFQKRATGMKMLVESVRIDELLPKLTEFLRQHKCNRVMLSETRLLTNLGAVHFLNGNGLHARTWRQITSDESYDYDAGVTEVDYAVAETGTLVIRHRPEHGRLISLVPFVHVAIVQPKDILPDLIDLFERLNREGTGSGVTMISGPSKTADIEMNTVTGVHGPNIVKAFVLS
ncbi:MAG TPA: LUD domain-containing protein [Tepidisphaeraceae bacterium]|nr:LUD domain-containing protein [Tepidisphaeraceae bacterium]